MPERNIGSTPGNLIQKGTHTYGQVSRRISRLSCPALTCTSLLLAYIRSVSA